MDPHPQQARSKMPSSVNVRKKVAIFQSMYSIVCRKEQLQIPHMQALILPSPPQIGNGHFLAYITS
jgi:hypothetical protein